MSTAYGNSMSFPDRSMLCFSKELNSPPIPCILLFKGRHIVFFLFTTKTSEPYTWLTRFSAFFRNFSPHKKGACFRRLPLCLTYALGGKVMPPTFTLMADTSRPVIDSTALLTLS